MKKIAVIGDGVFGTFLKKEFDKAIPDVFTWDQTDADIYILAVPSHAYESLAQTHHDKHLVNVCSTQARTNYICRKWSERITGLHPLFGPRTPEDQREAIVTYETDESQLVIDAFEAIMHGNKIQRVDFGNGWQHDEFMALTHVPVVKLQEQIQFIIRRAEHIPPELCPASFNKLRAFADTFGDMPDGTLKSILDNPML